MRPSEAPYRTVERAQRARPKRSGEQHRHTVTYVVAPWQNTSTLGTRDHHVLTIPSWRTESSPVCGSGGRSREVRTAEHVRPTSLERRGSRRTIKTFEAHAFGSGGR